MRKQIGWGLLIVGGILQVAEGFAQADATLGNVTYDQTAVGSIVAPIEKVLPIPLGYTLIVAGAIVLFALPALGVK
jgi:hypothetical protein